MLAMAAALMKKPTLMMPDEPETNLSPKLEDLVFENLMVAGGDQVGESLSRALFKKLWLAQEDEFDKESVEDFARL